MVADVKGAKIPLTKLLDIDTTTGSFKDKKDQMIQAWSEFDKTINEEIIKNADNPEKQEELKRLREVIREESGLNDIFKFGLNYNNSIQAIGKSEAGIEKLTDDTKDFTQEQWEMWLKVTNSTMDATEAVEAYKNAIKKSNVYKFENIGSLLSTGSVIDSDQYDKRYKELQTQYKREIALAKNAGAELNKTLYGNIDLNKRGILEWNEENLEKYKDAIESWGGAVEDYAGSISTVDAMSGEFDGVEIAFSPILQTVNGAVLLMANIVISYIDTLIANLDEGWTTEDLLAADIVGLEIDGVLVKELIADAGETAIHTGIAMHYVGKDGALAIAQQNLYNAKNANEIQQIKDCRSAAVYYLKRNSMLGMQLTFNCPIIPHLDVNKTIEISDRYADIANGIFVIQSITMPLSSNVMNISATNINWLPNDMQYEGISELLGEEGDD